MVLVITTLLATALTGIVRQAPVSASSSSVSTLAAGLFSSFDLSPNHTVWGWGYNQYGALGNGCTVSCAEQPNPAPVHGLSGVTAISAGNAVLALRSDGTLWAWGGHGPDLGLGYLPSGWVATPTQVPGLTGVTEVVSGSVSLALKSDGTVWAAGYNQYGQLGIGTTSGPEMCPTSSTQQTPCSTSYVQVAGLSGVVAISSGGMELALKSDGTVWSWGLNDFGQAGIGSASNTGCQCVATPTQILSGVTAVAAGGNHGLALRSDGTVLSWGMNQDYQLGTNPVGATDYSATPVQVCAPGVDYRFTPCTTFLTGVTAIAAGGNTSFALGSGPVWAWGNNDSGQLGLGYSGGGINGSVYLVTQIPGFGGPTGIVAAGEYTLASMPDGTVWGWGNGSGDALAGLGVGFIVTPTQLPGVPVDPLASGPTGSELFGSSNPGETGGPFDLVGAGVNAVTGNLASSVTDLAVPGRGPGLDFVRTYNSLDSSIGPVGYGWEDSYNLHLVIASGTGNVTVTNANGSTVPFTAPASGQTYGAPTWVTASLVGNATSGWTYTLKNQTAFAFNPAGQLTTVADRNGNQVTLSHDPAIGLLTTVTEGGTGRSLTLAYDSVPRLTAVTDSFGRSIQYFYDDAHNLPNNLDRVIDANGNVTRYTYNPGHQLVTMTDQDGNTTTFAYTSDGSLRIGSQTDALNRVFQFAWLSNGVTITDPRAIQTTITSEADQETTVTRAGVEVWEYYYDAFDNKQLAVDTNGGVWETTYDAKGNVVGTRNPLGHTTQTAYNPNNDPTTTTDQNGVSTTFGYDSHGNLLTVSTPLLGTSPQVRRTTTYGYDPDLPGDVVSVTDPDNKVWRYSYDPDGDRVSATDPVGDVTTYAYDAAGRMTSTVAPRGNCAGCQPAGFTTAFTYDNENHPLTTVDPLNHETVTTYYPGGKVRTAQDANGNVTTYTYDGDEEMHTVTRADGTIETINYDANGNVTSEVSALGGQDQVVYGYDNFDHTDATTFWDATGPRTTTSTNDPLGHPMVVTDPSGKTITYGYDAAGQLASVAYGDGTTHDVSFTYASNGQRKSMVDGTGTTTYAYDSLDRLTSVTSGSGATVQYAYNLRGLPTGLTYPGTHVVSRGYDDAGRLTSVQNWLGATTVFGYDADSNLTSETLPSTAGIVDRFGFDAADRLTGITDATGGATMFTAAYTRDAAGQVGTDNSAPATNSTYRYTVLNQLCYAASSNQSSCSTSSLGSQPFGYDAADDLTVLGSTQQTFNAGGELCWTAPVAGGCSSAPVGATTYAYDARGNRTGVSSAGSAPTTLTYDQANRLTAYGSTGTYGYNGDGLRVSKTVAGASTTQDVWDVSGGPPSLLEDGSTSYIYGPGGLPLEQVTTAGTLWLHHDQLGSTRLVTTSAGSPAATYAYDPYGNLTTSSGSPVTPFLYAGQYRDAESGLYYLRARYYDPTTGQFLTRDQKGTGLSDAYGYAADSPLNAVDPTGLLPCPLQALCDFFGGNGQRITDWFSAHSQDVARYTSATLNAAIALIPVVGEVRLAELGAEAGAVAGETATDEAAGGSTSLFRAVSDAERSDIQSFDGFRAGPNSYEGKLFATSAEDASRFGQINYKLGGGPFSIVEARVPTSFAQSLYSDVADNMRYLHVGEDQLDELNQLSQIKIWNWVPIAPWP